MGKTKRQVERESAARAAKVAAAAAESALTLAAVSGRAGDVDTTGWGPSPLELVEKAKRQRTGQLRKARQRNVAEGRRPDEDAPSDDGGGKETPTKTSDDGGGKKTPTETSSPRPSVVGMLLLGQSPKSSSDEDKESDKDKESDASKSTKTMSKAEIKRAAKREKDYTLAAAPPTSVRTA